MSPRNESLCYFIIDSAILKGLKFNHLILGLCPQPRFVSPRNEVHYVLKDYSTALELYMAVSILHEFIHFGENYTKIFLPYDNANNDPGFQFENQYYGGSVNFNYATGEITYERN